MARPAALIEPVSSISSSRRTLPGPIASATTPPFVLAALARPRSTRSVSAGLRPGAISGGVAALRVTRPALRAVRDMPPL